MRRILLLFSLVGFVIGTLAGLVGHFLLAPDGVREAVATTGVPTFYLSGITGVSGSVEDTIQGAVRDKLAHGGALLAAQPSDCTIDVGATFAHEMRDTDAVVTLIWRIRMGDGPEIARVQMRNIVPATMLDGDWSGDAPHIAHTVEEALHRIVTEKRVPIC